MNGRPGNGSPGGGPGNGSPGGPEGPIFELGADLENLDFSQLARTAKLAVGGLLVLGILWGLNWFVSFRVDWLWFQHLGHEDVLFEVVFTEAGLFLAGAAFFLVFAGGNLALVFRGTAALESVSGSASAMARRGLRWAGAAAVVALAVLLGNGLAGSWDMVLRWWHAVPFETTEPVFQLDLGFYVFTLPLLQMLRGWLLGVVVLTLVLVGAAYFLLARLPEARFLGGGSRQKVHLAGLGSVVLLLIAVGHWLDRYLALYSGDGAVYGVGYTEYHAAIPAYTFSAVVAVLAAGILVAGALTDSNRVMIGGVATWAVVAFVGIGLYPDFVQRFQVEPSELAREEPFLADHIELTRQGYGLDRVESRSHPARGEISAQTLADNQGTVQNVRLWDEGPLRQSYNQIQFFRLYYDFLRVATDRYEIGGQLRQVMLSTRELSPEKLPQEAQRWVNRHLQFTHGYGAAMSPVTEVAADGRPAFFLRDVPPTGDIELTRPEVYYGLKSLEYVVADTRMEEFNYPGEDGPVYSHYDGDGGVPIGGALRRLLYAWHFGDINLLISDEISAESRIQYHREVQERITRLVPFLSLDSSPYPVVAEGRLYWIQDAYTTSDYFPYSTPFQGRFNYIRNSVKIVVDAYHGRVDLYIADAEDPIIRTYDAVFPGLFAPMEEIPEFLKSHIRYPKDIFSVQVEMLLQYQMQDPTVFYNKEDQWSLPQETSFQQSRVLQPYYIVARLPEEPQEEFLLIQPFTPNNRHNLVAWIAARNDPEHYGELALYRFPSGRHVDGPNQIEARIDNDPVISEQFTLWGQVGSEVSRGNLLVIPLGESILYAEPIFLRPETLEFPELRRIILADARSVVMHPTLDRAVRALVGELPAVATPAEAGEAAPPPAEGEAAAPGTEEAGPAPAMTREELDAVVRSLEETIRQLERLLERLRRQGAGSSR